MGLTPRAGRPRFAHRKQTAATTSAAILNMSCIGAVAPSGNGDGKSKKTGIEALT